MLSVGLGLGLTAPRGAKGFNPITDLGSDLLAWWDAGYGVSTSGSQVTGWTDRKNGLTVSQALGASRPSFSATGFNGAPCVIFDGLDDRLTAAQPAIIPVGSAASWAFCVVDQVAAADPMNRIFLMWGGTNQDFLLFRRTSGVNRVNAIIGTGSGLVSAAEPTTDFTGRHLVCALVNPTSTSVSVDGGPYTTSTGVPGTTKNTLSIGAFNGSNQQNFQGSIRDIVITNALTAPQLASLTSYLLKRRNI